GRCPPSSLPFPYALSGDFNACVARILCGRPPSGAPSARTWAEGGRGASLSGAHTQSEPCIALPRASTFRERVLDGGCVEWWKRLRWHRGSTSRQPGRVDLRGALHKVV